MIGNSQVIEEINSKDQTQDTMPIFPENLKGIGAASAMMGIMITMFMHLQLNIAQASKDCFSVQCKTADHTVELMKKNIPLIEKIAKMQNVANDFEILAISCLGAGLVLGAGASVFTLVTACTGSAAAGTTGYANMEAGFATEKLGDNSTTVGMYQAYSTFFQKWVSVSSGRANTTTDISNALIRAVNTVISSYKNGAQRIFG